MNQNNIKPQEMLTGKAKEAFEQWLLTDGNEIIKNGTIEYDLYYMCKYMILSNMVISKIIDWLDSVGIYIDIQILPHFDEIEIVSVCWYANVATSHGCYNSDDHYPTRHEATQEAIKKAVEVFERRN